MGRRGGQRREREGKRAWEERSEKPKDRKMQEDKKGNQNVRGSWITEDN